MENLQVQGNFIWEKRVVTIMEWLAPLSIDSLRREKEEKNNNERQRAKKDKATVRTCTISAWLPTGSLVQLADSPNEPPCPPASHPTRAMFSRLK